MFMHVSESLRVPVCDLWHEGKHGGQPKFNELYPTASLFQRERQLFLDAEGRKG